ncbi:MAG: gamma-glutamylcyclotransferase [Betaproteobacteria bacterium]
MGDSAPPRHPAAPRDVQAMLQATRRQWGGKQDLWIFAYASLIWRPEFEPVEQRWARVHGYHRALKMWSRINRGTPERPGLVFALLQGGSCRGVAYRISRDQADETLERLWQREMLTGVYDPRWLPCLTDQGPVRALAFTLSRHSPNYTGELPASELRRIFRQASGRYGSTLDYARRTYECLRQAGIHDALLHRMLSHA